LALFSVVVAEEDEAHEAQFWVIAPLKKAEIATFNPSYQFTTTYGTQYRSIKRIK
jgi:hypothetical protein